MTDQREAQPQPQPEAPASRNAARHKKLKLEKQRTAFKRIIANPNGIYARRRMKVLRGEIYGR